MKETCFNCRHWQRALGLMFDPWATNQFHDLAGKEAIGTGHCEHPERPRGLTLSPYNCNRDWASKTAMVDVTPKTPALTSQPTPSQTPDLHNGGDRR
jgi:hypothetical protein